jgi:hypothetical protein
LGLLEAPARPGLSFSGAEFCYHFCYPTRRHRAEQAGTAAEREVRLKPENIDQAARDGIGRHGASRFSKTTSPISQGAWQQIRTSKEEKIALAAACTLINVRYRLWGRSGNLVLYQSLDCDSATPHLQGQRGAPRGSHPDATATPKRARLR